MAVMRRLQTDQGYVDMLHVVEGTYTLLDFAYEYQCGQARKRSEKHRRKREQ